MTTTLSPIHIALLDDHRLFRQGIAFILHRLPHGTGQTLLREAFLIADHAAYHTGEIILVRRLLHAWK